MPPFKEELGAEAGHRLAGELAQAWPAFPTRRFTNGLEEALAPLELLARSHELSRRLSEALPPSFADAERVVRSARASPGFAGWIVLPCGDFVARAGIDHPERALQLLAELTSRWSSELAIRPFIEQHPTITYEVLGGWLAHPDEHVRRLVSEGTRPRLPWAPRLGALVADPEPNVRLLDVLVDDPSPYVRRSVANHLNDIAKDHPDLALGLAERWLQRNGEAQRVVRHGLRTLIKRGDPQALALVGADLAGDIELLDLRPDRQRIAIGDALTFTFGLVLREGSPGPADAVIDYRVHYMGVRGMKAPRAFKLSRRRLAPGTRTTMRRSHRFEHVSIRRIHPGRHRIDVQVNGQVLGSFELDIDDP